MTEEFAEVTGRANVYPLVAKALTTIQALQPVDRALYLAMMIHCLAGDHAQELIGLVSEMVPQIAGRYRASL